MKQRGRKSIGDLQAVGFPDARVVAPDCLEGGELVEWHAIVNSLPADFFRPGDVPLLAAFCVASALHKEARADVRQNGMTIMNGRGTPVANPACGILSTQASAMATLASKLRLCPSARMVQVSAAKQSDDGAKGARPWDDGQRQSA